MEIFIQWVITGAGFTFGAILMIWSLDKINDMVSFVRKYGWKYTFKNQLWRM